MALLQALLALVGRSAGKILYAIFGWAVRALFGFTTGAQRILLTGLVASAAFWPLLLVGVALPRVAAFAIAFVPIPENVDERWLRVGWSSLAVLLPAVVGIVLAMRQPAVAPREPAWRRVARGYPITLGIAAAFWISFVTVPLQRLAAAMRGLKDAYIPLVTSAESYSPAADRIAMVLGDRGFDLRPGAPGLWTRLPLDILRALGGDALREFVPERLAYFESRTLVAVLFPSGLLLRGPERETTLAHGIAAEALANTDSYQTTSVEAQELERQIHRVWHVLELDESAHCGSTWLLARVRDITDELTRSEVPYDDWQIVYRQLLQLSRALRGELQLLGSDSAKRGEDMSTSPGASNPAAEFSTAELLREIGAMSAQLARKEIDLARAEIRKDFDAELAMLKALGFAAVFAIATLNLLIVAAVFALTQYAEGWLAALAMAGATLIIAVGTGMFGWSRRVTRPLERTRRTLQEDLKWAKERLA